MLQDRVSAQGPFPSLNESRALEEDIDQNTRGSDCCLQHVRTPMALFPEISCYRQRDAEE